MKRTGEIVLNDAIKTFVSDQDKVLSPQETLRKFKPRLGRLGLDVLSDTVRIDNGRLGIPVFFSLCGADGRKIIGTKKQMGKGATAVQAEASAVMELAERYSFFSFYKDKNNVITDTRENLTCDSLDFESIAKSVHDESDDIEISKEIFNLLPLKWTGAYDLTNEKEIAVPLDWFYAINAFNGPSAGNCVEEALCQGVCEVVERHVSSWISRKKISTPIIELESVTDSLVLEMLKKYSDAGITVQATDFTFGLGIPSVGVLAYDLNTFPDRSEIVWTAGTAPYPQKALSRALTEVAQLAGDFNTGSNYLASGLPKFNSISESNFVINSNASVNVHELPDVSNSNIKFEVENCINELSKLNMNVLAIDTTHSVLKIPAFYTIIPGACFRERAVTSKGSVAMFLAKIVSESFSLEESIKHLNNMDTLLPKKYFLQFYLGKCYLELREYEIAMKYFFKALEMDPERQDIPSIYSYLGVALKDIGRYSDAIRILKKGKSLDDGRTDIYNLLGFCHFMLKEYEKAILNFKNVLELDPSSAIDYANIGSSYRNMGQKEKAIRYYRLALEIDSSIQFASKNLAVLVAKD